MMRQRKNALPEPALAELTTKLRLQKAELTRRLRRIHESHRQPLEIDSKERATQLENREVVDALGNEAREELQKVTAALSRIEDGEFGHCVGCGEEIADNRLLAFPQANKCIECASLDEERQRFTG